MRLWPRKQVYVDDLPRTHDLRFAGMFMLLFIGLLLLLYAVGFFVAGDRLPRGTSVAGIDVGGMKRGEARAELQDQLLPRLEQPITVNALDQTFEIDPQVAGMTFDLEATLSEGLAGERWDPRHMLKVVLGGDALPTMIDVDNEELDATLQEIAAKVERPPVEASVRFQRGKPVTTPGEVGVALDFTGSSEALQNALLTGDDEIELPTENIDPQLTTTAVTDFAVDVAQPAVRGPVRIRAADVVRTVPAAVFAPALGVQLSGGKPQLTIDAGALAARSRQILASLPHHPVNARVVFRNGHPAVVPGRSGARVEPDNWADAVLRAAKRSGEERIAAAKVTPDPPAFTTEQARQLRVRERVAWGQVRVAPAQGADVVAAASRLNGALLRPEATFSFLQRVGATNPDAASLVASAAYDAAFRGGMSNLERTAPHVHTPGTEAGLDALVGSGIDLRWRNGTPFGVYVRAYVTGGGGGAGQLNVELWSTNYWRVIVQSPGPYNVVRPRVVRQIGSECRDRKGVSGFAIDVSRSFAGQGTGQRVETVHNEYAPLDTVVCRVRR